MNAPECPFCGADPFHYVDIGVGTEAAAVVCCDLGDLYFRGAREPITGDVVIDADMFREIGNKLAARQHALSVERARAIALEAALTDSNDLVADIHDRALEELKADKELRHDPYDMPDDCEVCVTITMGELRKAQQTASAALRALGQQDTGGAG